MMRTGPAVERFTQPASSEGKREAKVSGGSDDASFRKLLSKMGETGGGRAPAPDTSSPARAEARIAGRHASGAASGSGDPSAAAAGAATDDDASAPGESATADAAPAGADLSPASLLSAILAGAVQGTGTSRTADAQAGAQGNAAPAPTEVADDSADALLAGTAPKLTVLRQETFLAPGAQAVIAGKTGAAGTVGGLLAKEQDASSSDAGTDPQGLTTVAHGSRKDQVDALSAHGDGAGSGDAALAGDDGSGDALADPDLAASVARKDGGAAGHLSFSPIEQIADRVTREALTITGAARPAQANSVPATPSVATDVKVLHIELQPNDLGTVTVRMALKGDALELRVDVDTQETADLLRKDWEKLTSQLRAAGYQVDGVIVRVTNAEPTAAAGSSAQGFADTSTSSQSGSAQADARTSSGQGQREAHTSSSSPTTRGSHNEESRDPDRRAGGLYV